MSREKECKCCHEWWYASDIKQDLCPNCYDYFKQLKQQLADAEDHIDALELQLREQYQLVDEKDKEIESYKKNKAYIDMLYKESLELKLDNQTQLAIQELEKVKELVKDKSAWQSPFGLLKIQESDVEQIIDQQIKELKGEKDVKD